MKPLAFVSGVSLFALATGMLLAQSASSTRDGVYTKDQADQGHTIYTAQCAACHGPSLEGSGQNPALAGDGFMQNWEGQTVADLYGKILATMPASAPGTLKPDQVVKLIAYILSSNKFPAGKTELPQAPEKLQNIHIEMPLAAGQ